MIYNQIENMQISKKSGKKIKVNTVYLENINDSEIVPMFTRLRELGADCFNVLPQVSLQFSDGRMAGNMEHYSYLIEKLKEMRFPITRQCRRCRADFCGV